MKCEHCGYNLQIEDSFCPYCGQPNPFAVRHQREMQHFSREFQKTKQDVLEKSSRFNRRTVRITITAVLIAACAVMAFLCAAADDIRYMQNEKKIEAGAQLIVTTGGVSVGRKDYLPTVIDMIGGEILFHGIDVKPGMPSMLSKAGDTLILSLSGNPYSCACVFELIAGPMITAMLGKRCIRDRVLQIPAADSYNKRSPVRRILRG